MYLASRDRLYDTQKVLVKAPQTRIALRLDNILTAVRQVAEEVETGFFFQLVDRTSILGQMPVFYITIVGKRYAYHIVHLLIAAMGKKQSDGMIFPIFNLQQCHKEVARYQQSVVPTLENLMGQGAALTYGTALAYIERIGDRSAFGYFAHLRLHVPPRSMNAFRVFAAVKHSGLGLHIGEVKGLIVLHLPIHTVGRRTDMAMIVARPFDKIARFK